MKLRSHLLANAMLVAACAVSNPALADVVHEDAVLAPAAAAATAAPADAGGAEPVITTSARDFWGSWGVDTTAMKTEVKPGDDFNVHANGTWLDSFEIPADRSRYGAFTLLSEKSEQRVRAIIEEVAARNPNPRTLEGKIAASYNAYMDVAAINAAGMAPAQPYLQRIFSVTSNAELVQLFGAPGFASPISGFVDVDAKDTESYIFYMSLTGLGLPDRDNYLVDSEKNLEMRAKYKEMLAFLLGKAGYQDPAAAAEAVYGLEVEMARTYWDRAAGRNRDLTYNKVSRDELIAMAGNFPIAGLLEGIGVGAQPHFVVRQIPPTAEELAAAGITPEVAAAKFGGGVPAMMKLVGDAPLATWQAWLAARFIGSNSDVLPSDIDEATFAFYGKYLSGQEQQRERWKRAVSNVESQVGEAVGKVYADRYFPAANKAAMDDLVANLRRAMAANLDSITWMGDATKLEARAKLAAFTPKIGYPEKFETYDDLVLSPRLALANGIAAEHWGWKDNIDKLGKPIDRTEWGMLPQTVNAYYSPNRNEIVFPAAILQPPFFNLTADPAVNYGAIGGVIGHEMGHGFDDQGAKSDGKGVLRDWWTAEDKANFERLTGALVTQYNAMCPLDDGKTCINGRLTLGENIGDVGGLSMAYRAYRMSLNGAEAPVIDGLSGDQRFFLAWAQVWRNKSREAFVRNQLQTDPHSPADYRINGVVRNFDEWYRAFNVQPGDKLYLPPEQRIRIW